jgi:hypothetical protein
MEPENKLLIELLHKLHEYLQAHKKDRKLTIDNQSFSKADFSHLIQEEGKHDKEG